jgi:hypothetical protein
LSGRNIAVIFGTTAVTLAPQAFSSQLTISVPATLAPGETSVKVRIDDDSSNELTFVVLA